MNKEEFLNIESNHLKFSNNFEIDLNDDQIIFAPNGVGKTSIFKLFISENKFDRYFSQEDLKDNFIKNKKKINIGPNILRLNKLKKKKSELVEKIGSKTLLKKASISNAKIAAEYNFTDDFKENKVSTIHNVESVKNISQLIKEEILDNDFIKFAHINSSAYKEIKMSHTNKKELLEVLNYSLKNIENEICPVCSEARVGLSALLTEKIENIKNDIKDKIDILNSSKKFNLSMNNLEKNIESIKISKIEENDIKSYILLGTPTIAEINEYISNCEKNDDYDKEILSLEGDLENHYKNLSNNFDVIKQELEKYFPGSSINLDVDSFSLEITLKRDISTYSTGEINLMIFLVEILEFEYSDALTLCMDDPLTSFDTVNQYKIVYEIMRLRNNNKKIICLTHNIDMIEIFKSQHSGKFKYYFIDKFNSELIIKEIKLDSHNITNFIIEKCSTGRSITHRKDFPPEDFHYKGEKDLLINSMEEENDFYKMPIEG